MNRIACLICDEEGKSVYDIIPKESDYGIDSTYEALYNSLSDKYKGAYDVHFFAYDWRLSNSVSADLLNKYINDNGYENVILVCHSMGGLVASGYLALGTNQINKVETVITLGSPLLGAPIIPYLWGSEDLDSVGLLEITGMNKSYKSLIDLLTKCWDPLDTLICNFNSMYEIFPTEKYFDNSYAGSNYLFTSSSGNSRVAKTTYADTRTVLEKYLVRYNTEFINAAEQFHKSLYKDNEHITSLVNTYYIVGCNSTTTEEIEYNMSNWSICDRTIQGDSVVPAWSASLGDRYQDRTFYTKMNHVGLVKDENVISFICQLLDGNTTPPSAGAIYTEVEEACK